jgi:hypothetical protein
MQPKYLLNGKYRVYQDGELRAFYLSVTRPVKGARTDTMFRFVEHDHYDKTRISIRCGTGNSRYIPLAQTSVNSVVKELASRDREILDEIDAEIAEHKRAIAKLAVRKKGALTRAFNQGKPIPLAEIKKVIWQPTKK